MKKEIGLFLVFLFSVNLNADWLDVNMPLGVTDISEKVFGIHMLMFWIMVAIGAVVFGVLFYAMWRYRRSNHKNAAQFEENHKLEIAWTIVPTILLVLMALPASSLLKEMYDHEAEEGGIDIQVIGWQWKWHLHHCAHLYVAHVNGCVYMIAYHNVFACTAAVQNSVRISWALDYRLVPLNK